LQSIGLCAARGAGLLPTPEAKVYGSRCHGRSAETSTVPINPDSTWGALCPSAAARMRMLASLRQADMLSCAVSEADRHITIFTLAATPLACSAVTPSKHLDG